MVTSGCHLGVRRDIRRGSVVATTAARACIRQREWRNDQGRGYTWRDQSPAEATVFPLWLLRSNGWRSDLRGRHMCLHT